MFNFLSPGFWPGLEIFWCFGLWVFSSTNLQSGASKMTNPAARSHENAMTNWIGDTHFINQLVIPHRWNNCNTLWPIGCKKKKILLGHGVFLMKYPSLTQAAQPFSAGEGRLHPLPTLGWQTAVEHGFDVWFYYELFTYLTLNRRLSSTTMGI